jgi:voltage-gated potassium channel
MSARSERVARRFDVPMLIAALLVVPAIVIEESDFSAGWKAAGAILNWLIWVAFALELVVMLAVVSSRREWLRRHPLEVAIVLLTPPFLPVAIGSIRVLRLLRLLRLVRLAQLSRRVFSVEGLRYAGVLAAVTAVGGGTAFAAVEEGKTTGDGLWWAATTMTTVGYGDQYPVTALGRVIGVALMLVGIGFVAVLTGAVAERFIAREVEEAVVAAGELEEAEAEILAELRAVRARMEALERRLVRR